MNRFKIVLMASLLVQGVACLEAKADNTPEGNKTNSKALGVNAVSGKVTNDRARLCLAWWFAAETRMYRLI